MDERQPDAKGTPSPFKMVVLLWHFTCIGAWAVNFISSIALLVKMYGVIKDNKLMGLYHSKRFCPRLYREKRLTNGKIHHISRPVKKSNKFHCRFCIYMEAEERKINCFEICPQKTCLQRETLPEKMREDIYAIMA